MRLERMGLVAALAGVVLGSFVARVAGTRGGDGVEDCGACAQAARCCAAVAPGDPVCTFSEATCASTDGDRRRAYVNACRTFLSVAREAWKGKPPADCR
ncbi:MAG TPA: hypothetical protein VN903_36255 [Polyangia bacterium]|nr:hypothetical protein [Polyangia bacterium]